MGSWTHSYLPVTVEDNGPGGPAGVRAAGWVPQGTLAVAETQAAGTLYTVPAGKTFTGLLYIAPHGLVSVSAATGGSLGGVAASTGGPVSGPVVREVEVAGGGSGNAITVTGSPASVVLAGYLA